VAKIALKKEPNPAALIDKKTENSGTLGWVK
jgi:hypothetical protein